MKTVKNAKSGLRMIRWFNPLRLYFEIFTFCGLTLFALHIYRTEAHDFIHWFILTIMLVYALSFLIIIIQYSIIAIRSTIHIYPYENRFKIFHPRHKEIEVHNSAIKSATIYRSTLKKARLTQNGFCHLILKNNTQLVITHATISMDEMGELLHIGSHLEESYGVIINAIIPWKLFWKVV